MMNSQNQPVVPGRTTAVRAAVRAVLASALVLLLCHASAPQAAVYNLHLYADSNPDYTTVESFLETALPMWPEPRDKAIALWRWGVRNRRQTSITYEDGRGIFDPVLMFNSYANTNCGYIAGTLQAQVEALGGSWRARYIELSDHTVMEMSWDEGQTWHLFDASMNVYCYDDNGEVASVEQIRESHLSEAALQRGETAPVPGHHYLYNFALECGTNPVNSAHAADLGYPWGYRRAVDQPVPYARTLRNGADSYLTSVQYQDSYTHVRLGHRYRLNLRRGEHYTRYWHPLGGSSDYYRPDTQGRDPNAVHHAGDLRSNGLWRLNPGLTSTAYRLAIHDEAGTVHRSEAGTNGPSLHPLTTNATAQVTFKVYGANVITSALVDLLAQRASTADMLRVKISRDAGINWTTVWNAATTGMLEVQIPLSADLVGGAHDYLCRVEMSAASAPSSCGLDDIELTTITQVNRLSLPGLKLGANAVRLHLGDQEESHVLWPPLHIAEQGPQYLQTVNSSANVFAEDSNRRYYSAVLRPASGGVPAQLTWRFATPTDITGLRYGGSFLARESGPLDRVDLAHAFGDGAFVLDGSFAADSSPTWDGRLYADPGSVPPGQREVRLRYSFGSSHDADYLSTGIQDALMFVNYAPIDPVRLPVEVTWCWTEHRREGDVERQHSRVVPGTEESWQINVGGYRDPTMNWVRVNLLGSNPDGDVPAGYHDGEDVGTGAGHAPRHLLYRWQDEVSLGATYNASRAAWSGNGDEGGVELTNGCIIPATDYATSDLVQVQTALWQGDTPVMVTVDLGRERTVAALRITTHQPNAEFCHPDSITIAGAGATSGFASLGVIHHDQIWRPPGDFLGHEGDRSPAYAHLPAGGRLAYPYWLVLDEPRELRFLQCAFQPLPGRGVGISEIQALSAVTVADWPVREVHVPGVSSVAEMGDGEQPAARGPAGTLLVAAAPNPFNARMTVAYSLSAAQRVDVTVHDLRGRVVRRLAQSQRQLEGGHTLDWDGTDGQGRAAASGVYFVRVRGKIDRGSKAVVLVK